MTRNEKYGFKVSMNQFGQPVNSNFEDSSEKILIDIFEATCLQIKKTKSQQQYSMIELGSNQCYYSLLFKHIFGIDKTINIMVEPCSDYMCRSLNEFKINNCEGIFIPKPIGNKWVAHNTEFNEEEITLEEILKQTNISCVDVLHSDIDGSEIHLLENNLDFFKKSKAKHIFLCTHNNPTNTHNFCKNFFIKNTNYTIVLDLADCVCGHDSLLVLKSE